ncbi:hypothetical protein HGRIS_002953 [Hohenbuehelia grisea]|uniref:Uncharacterized protein n=1 Tax=Hohenbuehelia grisea TaxID=104357 RepID=A0ABR3JMU9_9AGAR
MAFSEAPDAFSSDAERLKYSQELAAYTLRQWTAARQSLERQRQAKADDQPFMTPTELALKRAAAKQKKAEQSLPAVSRAVKA